MGKKGIAAKKDIHTPGAVGGGLQRNITQARDGRRRIGFHRPKNTRGSEKTDGEHIGLTLQRVAFEFDKATAIHARNAGRSGEMTKTEVTKFMRNGKAYARVGHGIIKENIAGGRKKQGIAAGDGRR